MNDLILAPVHRRTVLLDRTTLCPRRARRHVLATAAAWQIPVSADDLELVASELTTNAVRHAHPPATRRDVIGVSLFIDWRHLVLTVHDGDPVFAPAGPFPGWGVAECGRGLDLVANLSDRFGWQLAPADFYMGPGKRFWAAWDIPAGGARCR